MVKYRDYFLETAPSQFGPDTVIGIKESKKDEFFHGLDPMLRRMPKELILQFLPPVIREVREVEMGAKQKKAYVQMRDKMIAELDDELLVVKSALTKMTRSLQFSSSYADVEYKMVPVIDKKTGETKIVNKAFVTLKDPSCKLDAFMDDLDDFGDESLVVFATSKQLVMMLSERLMKRGIDHGLITGDQDTAERLVHMDNFQRGITKLILCTISAGGTGITLTRGSTAVFLQRSWSMIENTQAEGRVHRIGSEIHDFVRIIDYVTLDTSEGLVLEAVEEKGRQLEFILRDKDRMKKFLAGEKVEVDTSEPLEDITEEIGDDGMELD
jgi:SNF2 family DNA or RNA helicase